MTALRIIGATCRLIALALIAYVVWTGWEPIVSVLQRHEVRLEFRPRALTINPPGPRWT